MVIKNPGLQELLAQVSNANPAAPTIVQPVSTSPSSGRLLAEAAAFQQSAPGLSLFKQLRGTAIAEDETKSAAAQKQALIQSMASDLQSKNYQGALAKYAQLDPEGVKSLLPQMEKIDPSLKGQLAFSGEGGQLAAQTEYGANQRQLLDAKLRSEEKLKAAELANKATTAPQEFTPGEKALDQAFAKDYAEYIKSGGAAKVEKSLKNLSVAENLFKQGKGASTGLISKTFAAFAPDAAQNILTPDVAKARDNIKDTVNQSLRAILGAQFTEKEGERLMQNTFNPSLGPKENLRRLDVLKQSILETARAQQGAIEHFKKNRTLRGYEGPMPGATTAAELTDSLLNKIESSSQPSEPVKSMKTVDINKFPAGSIIQNKQGQQFTVNPDGSLSPM